MKLRNLNSIYHVQVDVFISVILVYDRNIKILGRLQSYTEYPVSAIKTDLFLECVLSYKTLIYNLNFLDIDDFIQDNEQSLK